MSFILARMRGCAKMRCGQAATATVALRYADREVWIGDLVASADPNLLELCSEHADRLTPPRGWNRLDERGVAEPTVKPPQDLPEGLFA